MDAEKVAAKHIKDYTGFEVYLKVPEIRPSEFVTVERSASSGNRFMKKVQLTCQVWAKTRARVVEMCESVESAIYDLDSLTNVFSPQCGGFYEWIDSLSGMNRYQAIITISTQ